MKRLVIAGMLVVLTTVGSLHAEEVTYEEAAKRYMATAFKRTSTLSREDGLRADASIYAPVIAQLLNIIIMQNNDIIKLLEKQQKK